MTLDREAARALFANAEPTPDTDAPPMMQPSPFARTGHVERVEPEAAPFAAAPFAGQAQHQTRSTSARKGVDWRIAAPLGVAAVCVGAIALFALPQNQAQEGREVAAVDIAAPPVAPPVASTPAPVVAEAPAPALTPEAPAPVVPRVATPRAAAPARRAPTRTVAEREAAPAPSASDPANSSYASVTAPVTPPPPSLGAPVTVTPTLAPQPAPTPVEPQ